MTISGRSSLLISVSSSSRISGTSSCSIGGYGAVLGGIAHPDQRVSHRSLLSSFVHRGYVARSQITTNDSAPITRGRRCLPLRVDCTWPQLAMTEADEGQRRPRNFAPG